MITVRAEHNFLLKSIEEFVGRGQFAFVAGFVDLVRVNNYIVEVRLLDEVEEVSLLWSSLPVDQRSHCSLEFLNRLHDHKYVEFLPYPQRSLRKNDLRI